MIILAIDTSCDDTCVAILEIKNLKLEILSNIVSSQVKLHAKYGGVYPTLAKREHHKNLPLVLKKALKEARNPKIDLIAVTIGPGLEPCLWMGVNFTKDLAKSLKLPIIPINHIEAHIFANFTTRPGLVVQFPTICLVVSGGHTQLILMTTTSKSRMRFGDHIQYKILGETRDDAAGECFDKVARILGLGYPGGPAIAASAAKLKIKNLKLKIDLPRPMINQKNFDFSFSGLKTAVLYDFKDRSPEIRQSKEYIQIMATEVQQAIIDVLINKTLRATKEFNAKSVILGGGVAANNELRKQFREKIKKELPHTKYLIPDTKFCTDNAGMVGIAAYFHHLKGKDQNWQKILVDANLKIG